MTTDIARLDALVTGFTALLDRSPHETDLLGAGKRLLGDLVATDDWLPDIFAVPDPQHYRQYLLYRDPAARFSVVSFVWGPGQKTPVHDHTVWGLIGMLRGAEDETRFAAAADGSLAPVQQTRLLPGQVEAVSPHIGDIHQVANAFADRVSVSIHVYGADIGTVSRHVYDPTTGMAKSFVSGYANAG